MAKIAVRNMTVDVFTEYAQDINVNALMVIMDQSVIKN